MSTDNSLLNAVIGAAVTVVFSFAGVSPLLGGATAGYLERRDGARIGAISGALATLPVLMFVALAGVLLGFLGFGNVFNGIVLVLFAALFVGLYVVVLSTVGGVLGVYLAEEFRE
ncbi:hypothetical protein JCM30237_19780 [Halolamina litorea]|uniref:DUF5518 domain-containing protein n=1 Tax=Halolamina litorea TaxID=1515593 RepID=A0ABD6BUM3_9EURY|nr:DUF5518 domain-containing protein [Halolamina litorea]